MVNDIKITGDYNVLMADINRFKDNFEPLTSYEFGKMNDNIAKEYVKVFNNKMNRVAPSMAKATKKKTTSGKTYNSYVSVPQKTINYDKGDMRIININTNPSARTWVSKNWKWNKFNGWHISKGPYSNSSHIWGGPNKPKGKLVAMSRLAKGENSIIDDTTEEIKDFARNQLKEQAPVIFKRVGSRLLGKRVYRINMNIKLGK